MTPSINQNNSPRSLLDFELLLFSLKLLEFRKQITDNGWKQGYITSLTQEVGGQHWRSD